MGMFAQKNNNNFIKFYFVFISINKYIYFLCLLIPLLPRCFYVLIILKIYSLFFFVCSLYFVDGLLLFFVLILCFFCVIVSFFERLSCIFVVNYFIYLQVSD